MSLPNRRSIRLKGWDYTSEGLYYVTIVTKGTKHLFGEVVQSTAAEMQLNQVGLLAEHLWKSIPNMFHDVFLDAHIIMPNHIHGIIGIRNVGATFMVARSSTVAQSDENEKTRPQDERVRKNERATIKVARTRVPLGRIVGAFKSKFVHEYIQRVRKNEWGEFEGPIWHRNYYEHIIRNDRDLNRIRQYIRDNPKNWEMDNENHA